MIKPTSFMRGACHIVVIIFSSLSAIWSDFSIQWFLSLTTHRLWCEEEIVQNKAGLTPLYCGKIKKGACSSKRAVIYSSLLFSHTHSKRLRFVLFYFTQPNQPQADHLGGSTYLLCHNRLANEKYNTVAICQWCQYVSERHAGYISVHECGNVQIYPFPHVKLV